LCSIPFIVVVVVVVVVVAAAIAVGAIMCIYYSYNEDTSYNPLICLGTSQCCDNDNYDLPQYARRPVKWRDAVEGNKCRSIVIAFTAVTDTVFMNTCHYMLFPFLLLHGASF
jgi:hypothetical protein